MKAVTIIAVILFSIGFNICRAQPNAVFFGENQVYQFVKEDSILLQENLTYFGTPADYCYDSIEENFVISERTIPALIVFSKGGEQLKILGEIGRGPFEYSQPSLVYCDNKSIYVRDGRLSKIIAFDHQGNGKWEKVGFPIAFKNFAILNDTLFFTHSVSPPHNDYLKIFGITSEKELNSFSSPTNSDKLLGIYTGSGGLLYHKNHNRIYFSKPSETKIFYLIDHQKIDSVSFNDPDFKIDESTKLTTNSNWNELVNFITSNSRIAGLFQWNDHLIVQVEHGKENVNRFSKLFIFDSELKVVDVIKISSELKDQIENYRINFSSNEKLFAFRTFNNAKYLDIWTLELVN